MQSPEYYTIKQAAKIAGVSEFCIVYHMNNGRIQAVYAETGKRMVDPESLAIFMETRNREILAEREKEDHLYEIVCINLGVVDVLFTTHSLKELSFTYSRMVEYSQKLVRIRLDGVMLRICESDRLGLIYHPRSKKGGLYGEELERSEGSSKRHLPGHEQSCVFHGEKPDVLRHKADKASGDIGGHNRVPIGKPEKPVPAVPPCEPGSVQDDLGPSGREKRPGIPSRSGREGRLTDEERRRRTRERIKRWRKENPEKAREADRRQYQAHREAKIERNKKWAREHREQINAHRREWYRKKKEAENGTESK